MKFKFLTSILLTISLLAQAQLTINSSSMAVEPGTIVNTTADVNVNLSRGLGSSVLLLSGQDQALSASEDLIVAGLGIAGGGVKTINGNVAISTRLQFANGIISVPESSNLVLGANSEILGYASSNYINGRLIREQLDGTMVYPIGKNGTFTPVTISGVSGSGAFIAMEAFNEPVAGVTPPR